MHTRAQPCVNVDDRENAGARLTLADGSSLRAGTPANRHGLATLSRKCMALLQLIPKPETVIEVTMGLLPPGASANPTAGASWAYVPLPRQTMRLQPRG